MKIITWNIHGANQTSLVWQLILELSPDIVLLQEVRGIPDSIKEKYSVLSRLATTKAGTPQKFSTVILVKGRIIEEIILKSEYEWVNRELEFFKGNFVGCVVELNNHDQCNVVSVYSPAWPVDSSRLNGVDVSPLKLAGNPKIWPAEIIWSALKNTKRNDESWIVGGDFNCSETFDKEWQDKNGVRFGLRNSGNKELLDRLEHIGFMECLRQFNMKIVSTFKNPRGQINHQMDHLFVTSDIFKKISNCNVGIKDIVFGQRLSDHLPIIADFK